ncbi:MAG: hypothetical protein NTY53_08495, partial [Kiritimatiellaeota bacterium]|nr:hypothetical protein [Kiritimatiellota bacterium]
MNAIIKLTFSLLCGTLAARAELTNYTSGVLAGLNGVYDSLAAETTNSASAVCLVDMRHPDTVREAAKKPVSTNSV